VRRRFSFDAGDLDVLEDWIHDLGVRWGFDADHRRAQGLPALDANTWQVGLERLLLGVAMADEDLRRFADVVPYDGVEGRTSDLAGRLAELVERLDDATATMVDPRPVDAWRRAITDAADVLTHTDGDQLWQRVQLHRVLDDLVAEATSNGVVSPVALSLAEVTALLSQRLGGRPTTTSHRTGDLTVCTLVPMRSVPHRVVCLLGLDDGAFPRRVVPDDDDLLQFAPRVGDRDPRSEDRQLLLDALLAARDTLVVTYAGRDERTNEARPPAVPVDELLDVVDRTVATADDRRPREHVTVRHPLAEHDPRNFVPGGLRHGVPWGFLPASLEAARARRAVPEPPRAFLAHPLAPMDEDLIDLDDLVAFLQHPVKSFVRHRLEVALPGEDDERSDAIPSSLDGLGKWQVGDRLLEAWRRGDDLEHALTVIRGRGLVPAGELAADDLADVRHTVERIVALCGRQGIRPGRRREVDVRIELADGRLLAGTVPDVDGWRVETVGYSRVAPKHRLASWARYLAVVAHDPEPPWEAVTIGRSKGRRGTKAQAVRLGPLTDRPNAAVAEHLERLVDLYDRGRRAPLPLYCATSAKVADNLRRDRPPGAYLADEWTTNPHVPFPKEDIDPYHLLVLGGVVAGDALLDEVCRDAVEAGWADDDRRMVAYAWRLWQPILDAERSCES
jgi:exodeoxyribonuclease V gamma subunit